MNKKTILIILSMILVVLSGCGKKETPVEDLEYERVGSQIVITGYTGTDFDIVIPKEIDNRPVAAIGEGAFEEYDLKTLTLPEGLLSIEEDAFKGCRSLKKVELPDSLQYLGFDAFDGCDSLTEIELPGNVNFEIGSSNTPSGWIDVISSPFSSNTLVIVPAGSATHQALVENASIVSIYFDNKPTWYINFVTE